MFKVVTIDKLPQPVRNKKRSLAFTEEWTKLQERVASGLSPHEVAIAVFTPEQMKNLGVSTAKKVFVEMARHEIEKLGKTDEYDAWMYKDASGNTVLAVSGRPIYSTEIAEEDGERLHLTRRSAASRSYSTPARRKPGRPRKIAA